MRRITQTLLAICIVLPLLFYTTEAEATEGGTPTAEPPRRCSPGDDNAYTGYRWKADESLCIPGLVSITTWFTPSPPYTIGNAVWYMPKVMEATAHYRKLSLDGYLDGVSLMSPSDIGRTVWLRRDGGEWEGPYLVVDSAARGDIYPVVVHRGEVVEVGFETAVRWGMVDAVDWGYGYGAPFEINEWRLENIEVLKMDEVPPYIENHEPIRLSEWWADRAVFAHPATEVAYPVGLNQKYFDGFGWMWKADGDAFPVYPYDDWFDILFGDDPDYQFDLPNNYIEPLSDYCIFAVRWKRVICPGLPIAIGGLKP